MAKSRCVLAFDNILGDVNCFGHHLSFAAKRFVLSAFFFSSVFLCVECAEEFASAFRCIVVHFALVRFVAGK